MEVIPLKHRRVLEQAGAIALLLLLVLCCLAVLRPFFTAMLWAAILVFATWPLFAFLRRRVTRGNSYFAAAILVVLATLLLVVPLVALARSSLDMVSWAVEHLRLFRDDGIPRLVEAMQAHPVFAGHSELIRRMLTDSLDNPEQFTKWTIQTSRTTGEWLIRRGISIGYGLFQMAASLLFMFYFYITGEKLAANISQLMERLGGAFMGRLQWRMARTLNTVVRGTIGTAMVQAVAAGIGFYLFDVPHVGLFSVLIFMLGLLPFGPPLLWVPIGLWLLATGRLADGIGMLVYGGLVISSIDNVVRPFLIAGAGHLPSFFNRRRALITGILMGGITSAAFAFAGLPWAFGFIVAGLVVFSSYSSAAEVALLSGAIWLFATQRPVAGLWLLVFFILLFFIHPLLAELLKRHIREVHPTPKPDGEAGGGDSFAIVVIGVTGGLMAFGFIGLFLGPVLLALGQDFVIELARGSGDAEPAPPATQKENDTPAPA